jgi:hypothetical protein
MPEDLGGVKLITTGESQRAREQEAIELIVCFAMQALGPLLQPLKNERVEIELGVAPSAAAASAADGARLGEVGQEYREQIFPRARSSACFSTLCSSRTLPGQRYRRSRSIASGSTSRTSRPSSALKRLR